MNGIHEKRESSLESHPRPTEEFKAMSLTRSKSASRRILAPEPKTIAAGLMTVGMIK